MTESNIDKAGTTSNFVANVNADISFRQSEYVKQEMRFLSKSDLILR